MAKTSKELKPNMPLSEWLERYTKEELVDIAQLLGIGVPNQDNLKSVVVEELDSQIRHNIDSIIDITSVYELEFLRKLLSPENKYGIVSLNIDATLPLIRTGIILSCPHPLGKDYAIYMMLDEVKEYVRPYVELEYINKKQHGCHRLERLALGTLNLFGGMKAESLFDYIRKHADANDMKLWRNFEDYLLNNTLFGARRIFHINPEGRTDCFFGSPFIMDDTELHRMFNYAIWDKKTHNYVDYPKDTIMEYGQIPFPHIAAPSMDRLYDMMVHKAEKPLTEQEANQLLTKLWLARESSQNVEWVSLMTDIMLHVDLKYAETDDHQVSDALARTYRDLPMWDLDGKTTDDLLKPAPKPSTPKYFPLFQESTHKIGRNDPCWCGSGKKYKHCHGKNQ